MSKSSLLSTNSSIVIFLLLVQFYLLHSYLYRNSEHRAILLLMDVLLSSMREHGISPYVCFVLQKQSSFSALALRASIHRLMRSKIFCFVCLFHIALLKNVNTSYILIMKVFTAIRGDSKTRAIVIPFP